MPDEGGRSQLRITMARRMEEIYEAETGQKLKMEHVVHSEYRASINGKSARLILCPINFKDRQHRKAQRIRFTPNGMYENCILCVACMDHNYDLTHYFVEMMSTVGDRVTEPTESDHRVYVKFRPQELKTIFQSVKDPVKGLLDTNTSLSEALTAIMERK